MKRRLFQLFAVFIFCALTASIVEILIFNFKPLTTSEDSLYLSNTPYEITKEDDKTTLVLNIDNQHINKLIVNYTTEEKVNYVLSYTYLDLFSKPAEKTSKDIFEKTYPASVTNINKIVTDLKITFDSDAKITFKNIDIDNNFHFNYSRFLFITLSLYTLFLLYFFYKTGFKTEKLHIYFAILGMLVGTMIVVIQPVAAVYSWDDQTHFERVVTWFGGETNYTNAEYNISDSGLSISSGFNSIDSIDEQNYQNEYLNTSTEYSFKANNNFFTNHGKAPYIPMVIGYHGSKLLGLPFTTCFKIGKLINLLVFVLLIAYAIKTIKCGKRLLALISLLPANVFLAANYSYDPITFAGIAVFLAHAINLIMDKKKPNTRTLIIMFAAIAFACLAKAIYAPFLLLLFLIPKEKFKTKKRAVFFRIGLIFGILALLSTSVLPMLSSKSVGDPRGGDTSATRQISAMVKNPGDYTVVIGNSAVDQFSTKLFGSSTISMFGYSGAFSEKTNFYYALLFIIIFVFLTDNKGNNLTKKHRLKIGGIILLIIFLIWNALYLSYTPVGTNTIQGVQGRYFLPFIFPLLLILQPKTIKTTITEKNYNLLVTALPVIITIIMTYSLILIPYCL